MPPAVLSSVDKRASLTVVSSLFALPLFSLASGREGLYMCMEELIFLLFENC